MRTNIENALYEIKDTLENLIANYLDVNREYISVFLLKLEQIGEDIYDWSMDEDDALEEEDCETYYLVRYHYREDKRTLDYEEPEDIVWQHIESKNYRDGFVDRVMFEEEYDALFEKKKNDPCSMWYEE